jgi:hypothetical protein
VRCLRRDRSRPWAGRLRRDEWEAFLSLDGGATYPVRITPHLDRTLRQVTFRVPNLPTRNGRLLLRVGDEHREIAFELPERFTIAPARLETSPASLFSPSWSASRRGEPARPGDPGVLSWVEGSRQGGPVREVLAEVTAEPARAVPGVSWREGTSLPAGVSAETPPSGAPATNPDTPETLPPPRSMAAPHARAPRREAADLLLLIQRQNE